jgi:N-acyl-L-homoserine lactone synthetase
MTAVAMGSRMDLGSRTVSLMLEFRHDVFVKRLGWALAGTNGRETDRYDSEDAQYVVMTDAHGRITGSARLLPTTTSYMLPDLFPQLLGGEAPPRDSKVWELSRFAASVRARGDGRVLSLSDRTFELLHQVFELARRHDVARLLLVTSIGIERLMLRAGLAAHRIAPPASVDGELCVAVFIEVPALRATERYSAETAEKHPRSRTERQRELEAAARTVAGSADSSCAVAT